MSDTLPHTEDLVVFLTIVDEEGLNNAARTLGVPKSTLSRRLSRLEERVGGRLFERNRQRLQLTELGAMILEPARASVLALQGITDRAARVQTTPRGRLRVSIPRELVGYRKVWLDFMDNHPQISLEIEATDRIINPAREGVDVALRIEHKEEGGLIARSIGAYRRVVVASPAHVERWGRLSALSERSARSSVFVAPPPSTTHPPHLPHRNIAVDDLELALQAVLRGMGVAILPLNLVQPYLDAGRLVVALEQHHPPVVPLFAVYSEQTPLSGASQAFIDFVETHFSI